MAKNRSRPEEDTIQIPRKALYAIASCVPLTAILISKNNPGSLFLFLIGISVGTYLGKTLFEE